MSVKLMIASEAQVDCECSERYVHRLTDDDHVMTQRTVIVDADEILNDAQT